MDMLGPRGREEINFIKKLLANVEEAVRERSGILI